MEEKTCQIRVLGQDSFKNYNVEIDILSSGPVQRGHWEFRNLDKYAKTFVGCPILCAYVLTQIGDGHNMETKVGPDGETYESFTGATAERIVGSISDKEEDVWVHEMDGKTWVTARGKLWRFYAKELVDKIAEQKRMSVSAETDVDAASTETEDGREIYNIWTGLGVTILGDRVAPAVPGAHIRALAELTKEFDQCKLRVAALENEPQKKTEKKGVKRNMNARIKKDLEKLFPDYTVISCSEDGTHVLLLSKEGYTCSYQFMEGMPKNLVVAENICPASANVNYCFTDGTKISVDASEMMASMVAQLAASNCALEKCTAELASAKCEIETMQARECERRQYAAEDAVTKKLAEVNGLRSESARIDASVADGLLADCKAGKFNKCLSEDGKWIGDQEAVLRLMAIVGEEQTKQDKVRKASEHKPRYAWEHPDAGSGGNESVDDILRYINGN